MFKKLGAVLVAMAFAMLFAGASTALAAPGDVITTTDGYGSVITVGTESTPATVTVAGTSSAIANVVPQKPSSVAVSGQSSQVIEVLPTSKDLSYTGVSFNVPLALGIGVVIVLAGFLLIFLGGRGSLTGRRIH